MLKNKYQTFDLLIKFIGSTRLIDNNYHIIIKSLEDYVESGHVHVPNFLLYFILLFWNI